MDKFATNTLHFLTFLRSGQTRSRYFRSRCRDHDEIFSSPPNPNSPLHSSDKHNFGRSVNFSGEAVTVSGKRFFEGSYRINGNTWCKSENRVSTVDGYIRKSHVRLDDDKFLAE
jgi:hypothetical protein